MKKLLIITILLLTMFNHTYAQKPVELKDAIHILEVLSGVKEDVSSDPYKLIFSDEFNGNSLDISVWNYETGYGPYNDGWGNDEWQLYTSNEENVYVENGNLIISARTFGNFGKRDGNITSGRINTMGKQSFRYGKIQARIKIPYRLGLWAAFWMLGSNFPTDGWPKCGEIDIMETFAKYLPANQNQGTLHWWNESANIKTDSIAFNEFFYPYPNVGVFETPLNEDFHIYEIEWDYNKIVWRIDGIEYYKEYISQSNKSEFQKDFFIILNLAVGGNLGGYVDENTFPLDANNNPTPQNLYVDWVRVYQIIDKSFMEYAIHTANSIKDTVIVGNGIGQLPEIDFAPFSNAILAAQAVFDNEDATQNEVDQANEILIEATDNIHARIKRMDEEFAVIYSGTLSIFDQTHINEWSTGTRINPNGQYKGKNCWELTSGTKTTEDGNWGTVLAFVDGMIGDFSDYSKMDLTIATTGGYSTYKVSITSGTGSQQEFVLPVDDTTETWQDISVPISDLNSIQQIAIMGIGGDIGISKIYISDFKLVSKKFVLISSIDGFFSDVEFSANTIGEWSTGTAINYSALYEAKKCWELTSRGSWGSVLAFQDGINGDFSNYSKLKVSIATTGGYSEYKVIIIPVSGNDKEFVLPVDDATTSWQDLAVEISGVKDIKQIAILGEGGEAGVSKIYITDLYLVGEEKFALINAISSAKTLLNSTAVGNTPGHVSEADATTFSNAIATAQAINKKDDATQDEIKTALSALEAATTIFKAAIIVEESFVIISSDNNIQRSDVEISDSTIGEWGTRTYINPDAEYEGRKCWELTSGPNKPEEGNWGTVLAFQDGINEDLSDYSELNISIAITGDYNEYKVTFIPTTGSDKYYFLPVDNTKTSWQDISVKISGLEAIKQIAVFGVGGEAGVSKIYVTDFKLMKGNSSAISEKFVILSSDVNVTSDVAFNSTTIGEWGTGTTINGDAVYKDKKCWEIKSGSKTPEEGNWGGVLVFQNAINGDFSQYSKMKIKIATTGEYSAYKLSISACGVGKEVVMPVNNRMSEWQSFSIDTNEIPLNIKSIDSIAVIGVGGNSGTSKYYVTDFEIVKDKEVVLAQIDNDYIFKSSDSGVTSNLIVDNDNNSNQGNIIFGEWGTQTKLEETIFAGLNCWKLSAVAGWGAVLAMMGDISVGTNIDNYDVDLTKYTNIKFKIASEGAFDRYALSIGSAVAGNSAAQEVVFGLKEQASWNEIDIDLSYYGLDLANVSQIALFGVYTGGTAANQRIYLTDFMIYDTGIEKKVEKDSSDDKFVFKSSTAEQVDILIDGEDYAHNGNITIHDWSTNTGLQDTEYKGLNCWKLTKGNGWGAVLALMGDIYGDVLTYDIDLAKYNTVNFKIAAVGSFVKYFIKFLAGAEFAVKLESTSDWKDISINLNDIPLNLLKLQQIVIYGEGGNAGDKLYITDLNISK